MRFSGCLICLGWGGRMDLGLWARRSIGFVCINDNPDRQPEKGRRVCNFVAHAVCKQPTPAQTKQQRLIAPSRPTAKPISGCLNHLMQPENHNGTATVRHQMVLFNKTLLIAKMSASRRRTIGCRFGKGFSLKCPVGCAILLRTLFANNPTTRKQNGNGASPKAIQPPNSFSSCLNHLMQPENR